MLSLDVKYTRRVEHKFLGAILALLPHGPKTLTYSRVEHDLWCNKLTLRGTLMNGKFLPSQPKYLRSHSFVGRCFEQFIFSRGRLFSIVIQALKSVK